MLLSPSIMKNKTILLFMSTIRTLQREINDAINDVEVNPTSIRTRTKLGEFSDEKLEKLKTFVDNIDTGKLKGYMSTLPPLHINQLTADEYEDPFKMPLPKRWQIYKTFLKGHVDKLHVKIDSAIADYKKAYMRFDSVSSPDNIRLMKKMKVIGMTTTCAARMRDSLESVKFPIVVIEEAAEVLESHVISAVTKDCKHLILIGDHKQLRPAVADFEVETKYRLGVSLFERMVANGVECHTLDVQHRMRPEISSLIVPYIYPTLKDHESVKKYPDVRGVAGNMFFLHHEQPESNSGECSKENKHEADFLLKFAEYLLQNGYKPEEITILSAYLGQVTTLHRKRRSCSHPGMQQIPIKSVDDYQGEENKIILLSLVRNNEESKIGFLSNEKRVCVALSRAREGLYIMGNIKHLTSRSRLWKDIEHTLISQNDVGPKISLKCQLHNRITHVDSCKDFGHLEQGGCRRKCMKELDCGHVCPQQCHGRDIGHIAEYFCREKCERYPCRAHPKVRCTSLCSMECARCEASIDHKLTCGHLAKCYMFTLDEDRIGSLKDDSHCEEVVDMKLNCNHNTILKCYLKFDSLEKKCHECTNKTKKHVRFTKNTRL
ncbi:unnamed protein product [Acanthoscelides obtectus]|uniref:NFX1-type zinc finger-containing protein 1 n=1 Tax=Acanthoscelides obtectus TaxID=200917 RepID=A0A9P0PDL6_ACAOB|nr:unnamed protein product [Acanthoscelides obtectus]CAK1664960.1 NFX1-type zinc finger-containing protein 1 [Acanthoscelides obtectus]